MLIVKHPQYIQQAIGAKEDEVLLVHGPMSHADIKGGIRRVYEPRRGCEYPVHLSELREVPDPAPFRVRIQSAPGSKPSCKIVSVAGPAQKTEHGMTPGMMVTYRLK